MTRQIKEEVESEEEKTGKFEAIFQIAMIFSFIVFVMVGCGAALSVYGETVVYLFNTLFKPEVPMSIEIGVCSGIAVPLFVFVTIFLIRVNFVHKDGDDENV